MAALCEVYQLRVESRDQDSPETKGGDSEMMTAPDLVLIAKAHNAVCTETSQIAWIDHLQEWHELKHHRPSVLDAAVLDHAFKVGPSYFEAVKAATGWSRETIVAFQTIMSLWKAGTWIETICDTGKGSSWVSLSMRKSK
jgi:hypothetical protein